MCGCKKTFMHNVRTRVAEPESYRVVGFWVESESNFLSENQHFLILGVKWGFWAITVVPDMLKGQARALSTREII